MLDKNIASYLKNFIEKKKNDFIPWESLVPVSGKTFDEKELEYMIEAVMDCHRTEWRWNEKFEQWLSEFLGIKNVITVNSWSSANLLAITALTAKELWARQLKRWDEVITVASGFPTTINPIIQNWLTPVFVDLELWTYEVDLEELQKAISPKTKAIMLAHTLGNAFNLDAITSICKEHNLRLIEDNCDALWTKYDGKYTWTFGDIGTLSFYPAHHITMGEGGALVTNNPLLAKIIRSFRDRWRDCRCKTGHDDTCTMRFKRKSGDLPKWFDHKYIYSRMGYNLKVTDMQAALGVAQLEKLPRFIQQRKDNFHYLYEQFIQHGLDKYFIMPQATQKSDPSRFGFLLSVKADSWINREELVRFLNTNKIGTRLLFAWNYIRQPAFINYVKDYRVVWELINSDFVMNNTFWLWVYPWLTNEHLDYIVLKIKEFVNGK